MRALSLLSCISDINANSNRKEKKKKKNSIIPQGEISSNTLYLFEWIYLISRFKTTKLHGNVMEGYLSMNLSSS